jgi:exonuclease SbcD
VPIGPRHEVRRITGHLDDLLAHPETGASRNDFISVTLLDRGAVYDPIGKLRDIYPNVLEIKRPPVSAPERGAGHIDHRKMSDLDLFAGFYREVTGEALSSEQRKAFLGVLERVRQEEREA